MRCAGLVAPEFNFGITLELDFAHQPLRVIADVGRNGNALADDRFSSPWGLMRFAHCAKRACILPPTYRRLTASRRPGRNSWKRVTPPKRVSSATARVASAVVVTSWDTTRTPRCSPHNHDSFGLTTAGNPTSFRAARRSTTPPTK